jgi:2-aminobenzoate-CoA ligase
MDRIDCASCGAFRRDRFVDERLPPRDVWPDLTWRGAGLSFPSRMNAADMLLAGADGQARRDKPAIIGEHAAWTYGELLRTVDSIAHALTRDMGLVPGGRVLLRGPNTPWLAACWLAVVKAGGVVVSTMPLLRGVELAPLLRKTRPTAALCDLRFAEELEAAMRLECRPMRVAYFDGGADDRGERRPGRLESLIAKHAGPFAAVECAPEDPALICFTSGATGTPKAAAHFHRDLIAVADLSPRSILNTTADDVFCGSPSLAFAYGLGGLLLFPLRVGGAAVLVERGTPEKLLNVIINHGATILFAVPTAYRSLIALARRLELPQEIFARLRLCISAGEPLATATAQAWREVSGLTILDSLGTTEMLNAVLHAAPGAVKPGAVGKAVPGYEVRVVDADMHPLPAGELGRLAVRGPTGCRYLADDRQATYVRDGWNLTGDAGRLDEEGFFYHHGRTDDLIVSGGYKLSGVEIEDVLLRHDAVAECAVVSGPDRLRGAAPYAFVVPKEGVEVTEELARELQDFVRDQIAPFKYPRVVTFTDALPRTETGKIKRYRLREKAREPEEY